MNDEAGSIGLLLASHAAIAMAGSRKLSNMRIGMNTRDVIGQAKDILMERFKIVSSKRSICWSWHHRTAIANCMTSPRVSGNRRTYRVT